ncbi:MAG: hypothetical protein U1C74_16830 [Phenylobacterium sp.]|nr:hypothetical protein [Phenylobacterium sp.]
MGLATLGLAFAQSSVLSPQSSVHAAEPFVDCYTVRRSRIILQVCSWPPGVAKPSQERVAAIVRILDAAFPLPDDARFIISFIPPKMLLSADTAAFWDPASGTMFAEATADEYVNLYRLAHELSHALLGIKGVPIMDHHCRMFGEGHFLPVVYQLKEWSGQLRFYTTHILQGAKACE